MTTNTYWGEIYAAKFKNLHWQKLKKKLKLIFRRYFSANLVFIKQISFFKGFSELIHIAGGYRIFVRSAYHGETEGRRRSVRKWTVG